MSNLNFLDDTLRRVFFSRTPLRTPPGVRNGVRIGSTYGVRNE